MALDLVLLTGVDIEPGASIGQHDLGARQCPSSRHNPTPNIEVTIVAISEFQAETKHKIRAYVLNNLAPRGVQDVGDDQSLVESGVADSLGIFQMVAFLEETFGIAIGDHEIVQSNFETIEAVTNFVVRKHGGTHAAA